MSNVKARQFIERTIITKIITDVLALGCSISVNDGEEWVLKKSNSKKLILAALFSTDEDIMAIYDAEGVKLGTIWLVYGNDGYDVISDYSVSLEDILKNATMLAESFDDGSYWDNLKVKG